LDEALYLAEFERKRRELGQKLQSLQIQQRQLEAIAQQRIELGHLADTIEALCQQVRIGLEDATFEQKRTLLRLLVDQVVVTDEEVEIRYVMPIFPRGARQPFCQLRLDYRGGLSERLCHPTGSPTGTQALFNVL
jgi:site-specific DNA recombinase